MKATAAHKRFLAERRKRLLRRRFFRDGLNLGLLLLALNALARNLGPLALPWCQALALGSLVALAGIDLRLPVRLRSSRELAAGLGLLLGCGWGLRTADQSSVAVSLVAPATLGIALVLRGLGAPLRGAGGYVGTAAVYGLWVLVSTSVPWLGDGLSGISRLWSQWIGETFLRQPLLRRTDRSGRRYSDERRLLSCRGGQRTPRTPAVRIKARIGNCPGARGHPHRMARRAEFSGAGFPGGAFPNFSFKRDCWCWSGCSS